MGSGVWELRSGWREGSHPSAIRVLHPGGTLPEFLLGIPFPACALRGVGFVPGPRVGVGTQARRPWEHLTSVSFRRGGVAAGGPSVSSIPILRLSSPFASVFGGMRMSPQVPGRHPGVLALPKTSLRPTENAARGRTLSVRRDAAGLRPPTPRTRRANRHVSTSTTPGCTRFLSLGTRAVSGRCADVSGGAVQLERCSPWERRTGFRIPLPRSADVFVTLFLSRALAFCQV